VSTGFTLDTGKRKEKKDGKYLRAEGGGVQQRRGSVMAEAARLLIELSEDGSR
jgi:hypothetical protein